MAIGLGQYAIGRKNLRTAGGREVPNPLPRSGIPKAVLVAVVGVAVIVVAFATGLVTLANLARVVTGLIVVASMVLFVVILISPHISPTERSRVFAFIPMFIAIIASFAFFTIFQQIFTVIAIYAEQRVDLSVGGFSVPPAWAQSVDPVGIIIFAPVFAALWSKLGDRQPSTPIKFALGLLRIGVSFLLFLPMAGGSGRTSPALALGASCCCSASPS
jgi:POT family proton-dependent oligopeptide transporter